MRAPLVKWPWGFLLPAAVILLYSCTSNVHVESGTSSETVVGQVAFTGGEPASDLEVVVRSARYNPMIETSSTDGELNDGFVKTFELNELGEFEFELGETGEYILEVHDGDGLAVRRHFTKGDLSLNLGSLMLEATGSIKGSVLLPQGHFGTIMVSLLGSGTGTLIDSDSSDWQFSDIASGDYTISVQGVSPERAPVERLIKVNSDETQTVDPILLGDPAETGTGRISGTVLFPPGVTGNARVQLEGTAFETMADSGTGAFAIDTIPQGTYTIRVFDSEHYRDTLDATVEVLTGQTATVPDITLKIAVLIIGGINDHLWQVNESHYKTILEGSGLFAVQASHTPVINSPSESWDAWNPQFSRYDLLVMNFNNENDTLNLRWPRSVEVEFESFVTLGGGLLIPHNNMGSFKSSWPEYKIMRGLGSRNDTGWESSDVSLIFDSLGRQSTIPSAEASGFRTPTGDPVTMHVLNNSHPINQGLPNVWLHPRDDIVGWLKGPALNLTVLSAAEVPNTSEMYPIEWVVSYGLGRVYANMLGHGDLDEAVLTNQHRCAGFQTSFIRGAEWAATGQTSIPVPDDYPTASATSLRNVPVP